LDEGLSMLFTLLPVPKLFIDLRQGAIQTAHSRRRL